MKSSNGYKILAIAVLVLGLAGSIILASFLGGIGYTRNMAVTVGVFLCSGVPSILMAASLWYMGTMLEGTQLMLIRLREIKEKIEKEEKSINLILDEKLQEHQKWRCPDCGKIHSDQDVFCCGKKRV